ncbi:MAG: heavy metal-binding domain-containing protein [Pseudonocardiales bacterium]|nr:heavy metal-binding domain-containing protein [Pseudonocardiales bacterium]MBV9029799.1 heavy metal-binding domain-containing protein [Pseudonocardiales bacterium]MBW0008950.1 heavy metal-binding domain-containing protein [Pseudonocardiales bacterium]
MSEWDGRGLPPVAAERMRRFARTGLRTSLLTVPAAVGVQSVGFDPVGEVMGCIVEHIGWSGFGGCGYFGGIGGFGIAGGTVTSSGSVPFVGFGPYVDALYQGYDTALGRMTEEAAAMDADGVVGVRLSVSHLGSRTGAGNREFTALGTAVRARSRHRPSRVFTTDLAGQDVAKLVQAGWVPVALVYGISVAVRHDDWRTQRQASWGAGNTEVSGYTELVVHVRADARHRFDRQARSAGAQGAIVSSMSLRIGEMEPAENHRDHVAEASVFGTALVSFHRGPRAPTRSLTILPLRQK